MIRRSSSLLWLSPTLNNFLKLRYSCTTNHKSLSTVAIKSFTFSKYSQNLKPISTGVVPALLRLVHKRELTTEAGKSKSGGSTNKMPKHQKRKECHQDNILWLDMEMTGLNPRYDKIMEIACIVTSDELEILGEMETIIVHQPKDVLDNMNAWCVEQHGKSGLTQKCIDSTTTLEQAEQVITDFVAQYCPPNKCPIAGNSVGTDVQFLRAQMPNLSKQLHYRIIDVSSIKELCRRWYPSVFSRVPKKQLTHRALDDIRESIEELIYYRAHVFK